jgi:hypothetical protein
MMPTPDIRVVLEGAPQAGTLLWWSALAGILAVLGAGLVRILTAGARLVRFLTRVEKSLEDLTLSVTKLTTSDEARGLAGLMVTEQLGRMGTALTNMASLGGTRYDAHEARLNVHENRIDAIEHVPSVKRALDL